MPVTKAVCDALFERIGQEAFFLRRTDNVGNIRTDDDVRAVRGFPYDPIERVLQALFRRLAGENVHALAKFFQGVFRL